MGYYVLSECIVTSVCYNILPWEGTVWDDWCISDILPDFPVSPPIMGLIVWNPLRNSCVVNFAFNKDVDVKGQNSLFAFFLSFSDPHPFPSIFIGRYPWGFLQCLQKKWAVADVWHMFTCLSPGLSGSASENHSQGHVDLSQMSRPGTV